MSKKVIIVLASETGAKLDSDVYIGGGTDDTKILQRTLDKAVENAGIKLIMDGAALISGLKLHSNTEIECLNPECGFYLVDNSNTSILCNADLDFSKIRNKNIIVKGGTYNHNCRNQIHHYISENEEIANIDGTRWVIGFEFYGVENLTIRDVILRDQRTFAMLIANWKYVDITNVRIDLPNHSDFQNQDGIHFWGPGQFLVMRNICGRSGDDFIALAPDERDKTSSITDVLIDGVMLDNADQGIRLLSRDKGRLDRVTIRNISGTYRSFGFYINSWFPDTSCGSFGNIVFENIDLRTSKPNYDYRPPFLFQIGGKIESLTIRNIQSHLPSDDRVLFELSQPFYDFNYKEACTHIRSLVIDGLHVLSDDLLSGPLIIIDCEIESFVLRNIELDVPDNNENETPMILTRDRCHVKRMRVSDCNFEGKGKFIEIPSGEIESIVLNNIEFKA